MAKLSPLWPFYAALPLMLPPEFPAVLPLQRAAERRRVPGWLVRGAWATLFIALALAQPVLKEGHVLNLKARL
jgi:hypothetical protein